MKTTEKKFPVRGYYGFQLTVRDMEINDGRSETIQDDSYSVRDILEKFRVNGETVDSHLGLYQDEVTHDSVDLRQVQNLDLVDREALLADVKLRQEVARQKLEEYRRKVDAENEAARERAQQDEQDAETKSDDRRRSEKYKQKSESKSAPKDDE